MKISLKSSFLSSDSNSENLCAFISNNKTQQAPKNQKFGEYKLTELEFEKKHTFSLYLELEKEKKEGEITSSLTIQERLRRSLSKMEIFLFKEFSTVVFDLDSLKNKHLSLELFVEIITETVLLSSYQFEEYKTKKVPLKCKEVILLTAQKDLQKAKEVLESTQIISNAINMARDLINTPPNILYPESYAQKIQEEMTLLNKKYKNSVTTKILDLKAIKNERMNLLLAVNAGSGKEPRVVHLHYSPKKKTSKTPHLAFVGKGLTFDTGGLNVKTPYNNMNGMKYDMGGSATVYAAFKALVELQTPLELTCVLGITENAIGPNATFPDSIITSRKGTTVEIINTDAEGRLVLADVLDYTCDQKPTHLIDCATLTGAIVLSLGEEVCGLMGNSSSFLEKIEKSAKETDEYIWRLPLIQEHKEDIISPIADIANLGKKTGQAGSQKAAVFLEHFIGKSIQWAHLDIAGIASNQSHLPYCPNKGGSGLMIRTLVKLTQNLINKE